MKATSAMIFQESQVKHKIERETELKLQKLNQQTTLTKVDENNICLIDQQRRASIDSAPRSETDKKDF